MIVSDFSAASTDWLALLLRPVMEDGFDPLFVQQQVGHSWASTTALYMGVSSDFKNTALRQVLDRRLDG